MNSPKRNDDDWHLREWAELAGKRQADLVKDLGWLKARASKVWNGSIPYRKDIVLELANWLGVRPFELLMRPSEALRLRRLRETAALIVAEGEADEFEPAPPPAAKVAGKR